MYSSVIAALKVAAGFVPAVMCVFVIFCCRAYTHQCVHNNKREVNILCFQSNTQVLYSLCIYGIDCHYFKGSFHI